MSDQKSNESPAGLAGLIKQGIVNYMKDVHTAIPGEIVDFDSSNQTASVQPLIKRKFTNGEFVDLPLLINVPVWQPRAGGFSITFPIAKGDECLIIFSERSIDTWFKFSGKQEPNAWRLHDLSDAICLVGMASEPKAISGYDGSNFQIRNEGNDLYITIKPNGQIDIKAGSKVLITAPSVECSANLKVGGNLEVTGNATIGGNAVVSGSVTAASVLAATVTASTGVSSGGTSFNTHVHGGVQTGSGQTTGPV